MAEKTDSSVKLFSYEDDQPREAIGSLIPRPGEKFTAKTAKSNASKGTKRFSLAFLSVAGLMILGSANYELVFFEGQPAAPIVTIVNPNTQLESTLDYGPQDILSDKNLFIQTRDTFSDSGMTFLELDLETKQLRFFVNGVLVKSAEVLFVPNSDSWWNTQSGLYKIDGKEEDQFSSSAQADLPWVLSSQGNLMVHGIPKYTGKLIEQRYDGAGVVVEDAIAEYLYNETEEGLPVLVHKTKKNTEDNFTYTPKAPEVGAKNYFVADIQNDTILISNEIDKVASIASLTKLMTAVVANEQFSLDSRVKVSSPSFVTSLIPRLSDRNTVSMYSLMQLLLVESSNEAAETIAGQVDREKFIEAMNEKASMLGMVNTSFADPSGLSSENVSTVGDLFKLVKYIYNEKPFVFGMTASGELDSVYSANEFDGLVNFNEIEDIDTFIGGKVGETEAAGQTSISLHKVNFDGQERILVVEILGSEDRTDDVITLLGHVEERFGD